MPISNAMIQDAIKSYERCDYDYHFELVEENSPFVNVAIATFAKTFYGEILACMPTSLFKLDMIPKGYLVTTLFIYCDEVKPIFIDDIKKVSLVNREIIIEYHHGGKRNYEGGTFYLEVYHLLEKLVIDSPQDYTFDEAYALRYSIVTYEDDGGYAFELASKKIRQRASEVFHIQEESVIGYLDTSFSSDFKAGFVITTDHLYSGFFLSHLQEPIDLNDIIEVSYKRNRLILHHLDGHQSIRYVSVYGSDVTNLINLYLKTRSK